MKKSKHRKIKGNQCPCFINALAWAADIGNDGLLVTCMLCSRQWRVGVK